MGIARREARESRHWLRLIERVGVIKDHSAIYKEITWQIGEAKELMLILSSIINRTNKK